MIILECLILFTAVILGGFAAFFIKKTGIAKLNLMLSFSGAWLFAICVLHLLPEVFLHGSGKYIGVMIIGGFFLQIILEQMTRGVEHGHLHKQKDGEDLSIGLIIGLCIHAFLEAIPIASSEGLELPIGIAMHHMPASFALCSMLKENGVRQRTLVFMLFIFAVMSPMGLLAGLYVNLNDHDSFIYNGITAIVIGIFLHISTTILFESGEGHHFNYSKAIAVVSGFVMAVILFFVGGH